MQALAEAMMADLVLSPGLYTDDLYGLEEVSSPLSLLAMRSFTHSFSNCLLITDHVPGIGQQTKRGLPAS